MLRVKFLLYAFVGLGLAAFYARLALASIEGMDIGMLDVALGLPIACFVMFVLTIPAFLLYGLASNYLTAVDGLLFVVPAGLVIFDTAVSVVTYLSLFFEPVEWMMTMINSLAFASLSLVCIRCTYVFLRIAAHATLEPKLMVGVPNKYSAVLINRKIK